MSRYTQPRRTRPKVISDVEAIFLIEDIQTLELIEYLLSRLDKRTLSDDDNEASTTLRRIAFVVSACRNKARTKLAHFWLCGEVVPQREKPQTLADIWAIIKMNEPERPLSKMS